MQDSIITTPQQALEAYKAEINSKVLTLPLQNVRMFFIEDTGMDIFKEDLLFLKEFVQTAFLLLPDHRPDGEHLFNLFSMLDSFLDELQIDIDTQSRIEKESLDITEKTLSEFWSERHTEAENKNKEAFEEIGALNQEIGGLQYCLSYYLHFKEFFNKVEFMVRCFKQGNKSECEIQTEFMKAIENYYTAFDYDHKSNIDKEYSEVFNSLINSVASDYMLGQITEQEAQEKFISYVKQFYKIEPKQTNVA